MRSFVRNLAALSLAVVVASTAVAQQINGPLGAASLLTDISAPAESPIMLATGAPAQATGECTPCSYTSSLYAAGAGSDNPWYISVSGGWQHRETAHEVDDHQTFIEFRDGFLVNAALGAEFDVFRMEFETTFMNNDVETAGAGGAASPAPGNVNLRAYMFNLYHDIELNGSLWKPYVGGGIGVYQSEINGLYPDFFGSGPPLQYNPVNATSDVPFAYQFRLGVTRPVGTHTQFYTGYRYFRGEELEFASIPFATFAPTFHPDGAKIHALEVGLRVNF